MQRTFLTTIVFFALSMVFTAAQTQTHPAVVDPISDASNMLAKQAISADPVQAAAALKQLRAMGPAGLEALLALPHGAESSDVAMTFKWQAAVDAVACQHEASGSRLYWFTDLDQAKKAAQSTGKPIISLRLLGKLTDECSCANSRFFRKTLYPNPNVSDYLRQNFVLHWQSVRPVPIVTIDFGDGRSLKQTVTGNSIHYLLDSQGRVVDALPGLYTPAEFLKQIAAARPIAIKCGRLSDAERRASLRQYHTNTIKRSDVALQEELLASGAFGVNVASLLETKADEGVADRIWQQIAARRAASTTVPRKRQLPAAAAGRLAMPKLVIERPLLEVVSEFDRLSIIDTVRNEYSLHRRIHQWLADAEHQALPVDAFNEAVYREIFLSPVDDPWYGLKPEVFTGLKNDGVNTSQLSQSMR